MTRRDTPHFQVPLFTPVLQASPEVNSTTTSPIRDLFFGGYSARRQLHVGIRLIPTLSILMELQGWRSQIFDCRLLHNHCPEFNSVFWRLLGSTPATRRYKKRPYAVNTHGVTGLAISNARWQITPQPLHGFQFCLLEIVGLNVSYTPV